MCSSDLGIAGVEGQVSPPGFEDAKQGYDEVERAIHTDGDKIGRASCRERV